MSHTSANRNKIILKISLFFFRSCQVGTLNLICFIVVVCCCIILQCWFDKLRAVIVTDG